MVLRSSLAETDRRNLLVRSGLRRWLQVPVPCLGHARVSSGGRSPGRQATQQVPVPFSPKGACPNPCRCQPGRPQSGPRSSRTFRGAIPDPTTPSPAPLARRRVPVPVPRPQFRAGQGPSRTLAMILARNMFVVRGLRRELQVPVPVRRRSAPVRPRPARDKARSFAPGLVGFLAAARAAVVVTATCRCRRSPCRCGPGPPAASAGGRGSASSPRASARSPRPTAGRPPPPSVPGRR